jgi:hypothetical protein
MMDASGRLGLPTGWYDLLAGLSKCPAIDFYSLTI